MKGVVETKASCPLEVNESKNSTEKKGQAPKAKKYRDNKTWTKS